MEKANDNESTHWLLRWDPMLMYFTKKYWTLLKYWFFLGADDRDLGKQATQLIVDEGYKLANVLPG